MNLFEQLEHNLIGRSRSVVHLDLTNKFFTAEFVEQCINEFAKVSAMTQAGINRVSPLERLAIMLLLDSAGIDLPQEQNKLD